MEIFVFVKVGLKMVILRKRNFMLCFRCENKLKKRDILCLEYSYVFYFFGCVNLF